AGHHQAGHQRRRDHLADRAPVDDRVCEREDHASAVSAEPRCSLRANTIPIASSSRIETTSGPAAPVPKIRVTPQVTAAIAPAPGIVSIQATTMFPATPQ